MGPLCESEVTENIHVPLPLKHKANLHEPGDNERRGEDLEFFFHFLYPCPFRSHKAILCPVKSGGSRGGEFIGTVLKGRPLKRGFDVEFGAPGPSPGTSSTDQRLSQRKKSLAGGLC